ncbi:hypothetical protein F383_13770 [Gossypium arboreum]|uniref:Uncharacterized protein n=1 Tax=Gossypium arboreum TaxID=29729 RepID=A0A0B0PTV7_GOSAR|nr:hypothetical protein F383_13770 [Gossypium arboreum]
MCCRVRPSLEHWHRLVTCKTLSGTVASIFDYM